jgi:hypothetical protein
MRRVTVILATILITGNLMTESWGWLPERWTNQQFDLFMKPGFHLSISFAWYMKMLMDDINSVLVFYVLAVVSDLFSRTLFYVVGVLLLYHVVDAFLLIWDFKQTKEIYWVMLVVSVSAILILLRKKGLKIIR